MGKDLLNDMDFSAAMFNPIHVESGIWVEYLLEDAYRQKPVFLRQTSKFLTGSLLSRLDSFFLCWGTT